MTVEAFMTLVAQVTFAALGIFTVIDYLRHRDAIRRDIVLMLATIAIPMLASLIAQVTPLPEWVAILVTLPILSQPYLLLRLVEYLRPVPLWLMRVAIGGMIFSSLAVAIMQDNLSSGVALIMLVYFTLANGYAAYAFIRGAFTTNGVVRQRLRFTAIGAGMFAIMLVVVGVMLIWPAIAGTGSILLLLVLSALSFYVGFVPPAWLRRFWQFTEVHDFLMDLSRLSFQRNTTARSSSAIETLGATANRLVSGDLVVILEQEHTGDQWHVLYANGHTEFDHSAIGSDSAIFAIKTTRQPVQLGRSDQLASSDARLLKHLNMEMLSAVPIMTSDNFLGILLVFNTKRSLFPADDLALLTLLGQQAAIFLENIRLLEQMENYLAGLEEAVIERTQEIQTLNNELEQRVIQRTAELEATNKELEAFSYSVSHDLRAPLRGITTMSQFLLDDYHNVLDDDGKDYLNIIQDETRKMNLLIDNLLKLSRITRRELAFKQVDLSQIARDIADELQRQSPERQVEFIIADGLTACADPHLIRVVLQNLMENAWKYTSKQEKTTIEFGAETTPTNETQFFVRDNGVGFDMHHADKLFGAFQRLHSADEFEGTGIGLATVQRVIHRHGGQIHATGQPDSGATFSFTVGHDNCVSE